MVTAPDISGNIILKNNTDVTYAVQNTTASAKDRIGVIEFVDMDTITNLLGKHTKEKVVAALNKRKNQGSLNYNLDIEVEREAKFNIIVDPNTRDLLQVQGEAQLTAGVNPNGAVSLVGAYNLNKGSYDLHYQFLTRKFILSDKSTVTLTGNPSQANIDITAVYTVETNAVDLIGNEVQSPSTETNYKAKVPFDVILHIKGSIVKPALSFDIKRKENAEGVDYNTATVVDNKLEQLRSDTSAMNKQVFALLIMNRFIGEQSRDFLPAIITIPITAYWPMPV